MNLIEMGDLFVLTTMGLLRLDLKNYEFDPAAASESGEEPPRPDICFIDDDAYSVTVRPKRGVMKLGSKVYFVGGRSKKIYQYDPSKNSTEESVLCFNEIKDWPVVEEIEGKIYVFHRYPSFPYTPTTSLEVLDPSSPNLSWEKLQDPESKWFTHFVLRHKLYALTEKQLYYFDTRTKKWGTDDDMFRYKPLRYKPHMLDQMKIPRDGRRVCENIIVAVQGVEDRDEVSRRCFLYGYLYSEDCILLACQNLGDLFGEHELNGLSSHLIAMGDGKFCALAVGALSQYRCFGRPVEDPYLGPTYFSEFVLGVSVFNVSKLPNAEQLLVKIPTTDTNAEFAFVDPADPTPKEEEFLSLSIEKTCFFDLREIGASSVLGAFFA